MISEHGEVETAHKFIRKPVVSEGLVTLWELKRLDLSLEYVVLKDEFHELFEEDERKICKERLKLYGIMTLMRFNVSDKNHDTFICHGIWDCNR